MEYDSNIGNVKNILERCVFFTHDIFFFATFARR